MKVNKLEILGISGSLRNSSSNTSLLRAAAALAPDHVNLTLYDGLGDLPHFNPDINGDEPPISVRDFRAQLKAADGVLICTPEYAGGVPGVLKNALDWIVSSAELMNKPAAVISASPSFAGGEKAHASLLITMNMLADVVEGGRMTVPFVSKKINAEGEITDSATAHELRLLLDALSAKILSK